MGKIIFAIIIIILFVYYYYIIIKSYFINKKRWEQAIPVEAKIVSIKDEVYDHECHGDDFYKYVFTATRCTVSFHVNAMEYVQDAMIEKRKRKIQVGDFVEIRYCYNTKQEIEIVDKIKLNKSFSNMLFGMLILLLMVLVVLKFF